MKTITSFLSGILLFCFGMSLVSAAPACNRAKHPDVCRTEHKKAQSRNMDRMQQRSLRRQHTREAYDRHYMNQAHGANENASRFNKSKRMTPDERNRMRQQIDEVGQAIYHQ